MTAELALLTPFAALGAPNRVAMAPMTRNRASAERAPTELMATYYAQRATAGLLVSESIDVSERAIGYPGTPGLYRDDQVLGWTALVRVVRLAQPAPAPFFAQLFHTGRVGHPAGRPDGSLPIGPSPIAAAVQLYTAEGMKDAAVPEAMSQQVIDETVAEYASAAAKAIEAGFDGVEINAGNGYLVDQFLRDGSNQRTDGYGGSIANRARFLLEITAAVSKAIGPERVGVRISPYNKSNGVDDSDPAALFTYVTEQLAGRGLAYLHIIEAAANCTLTPSLREAFDGPIIVNDGYDRERAEKALNSGLADLVSFGRAFLANPDLPRRLAEGAALNEADPATFYGGTDAGYTDYAALD